MYLNQSFINLIESDNLVSDFLFQKKICSLYSKVYPQKRFQKNKKSKVKHSLN